MNGIADTEYAAAARRLAERLQSLAAPGPDGAPVWFGDDVDPVRSTGQRVVLSHGRLDDGLLTGRTGSTSSPDQTGAPSGPGAARDCSRSARRRAAAAYSVSAVTVSNPFTSTPSPPRAPPGPAGPGRR